MGSSTQKRHKTNMKGILLRRLAGANIKDNTGLMIRALDKISMLFDSNDPDHWEVALTNLNRMLPYAIPKESYEHPLLRIDTNNKDGNTQVFIQLNQFMDDRKARKEEINGINAVNTEIVDSGPDNANIKTVSLPTSISNPTDDNKPSNDK